MTTLLVLLVAQCGTSPLYDALKQVHFYNGDTARASDVYANIPMPETSYNEQDNVTCVLCGWNVHGSAWTYPFQNDTGSPTAPPLGIRSAPQLGGVGAGSIELRADGSFRDWTIARRLVGPACSARIRPNT
jgi:non-lysosomal glucosylceramidase